MKTMRNLSVVMAAAVTFAACGNNTETREAANQIDHTGHDQAPAGSGATVQLKDDNLNAVYQHYAHLTTALVNGDQAEAKIAGNAIEAGAKETPGGEALASSASKIIVASDIEAQRTEFSTLSNEFIALAKKSGVKSGELYVDYCPMALNDKGAYWLSANKEIKNPYFGDKMLTCGEVKETIN